MSKMKMSFSLILAILLVGILSTAVFAAGPRFVAYQQGLGITAVVTGGAANTSYTFVVNVAGTDLDPVTVTTDANGMFTQSVTLTKTQLSGQAVTVKLYSDATKTTQVGSTINITTSYISNDSLNKANMTVSGLPNSNHTGTDYTRKNKSTPSKQNMHGFYQNNTNSCASCHQTHTAANGDSLLFKDGTYSTCSACHDGTTGALNNFSPVSASMVTSVDGTFNVQQVDANGVNHNGSAHQADGSLQISAAPGGNHSTDSTVTGSSLYKATWGAEFDCASCHSAHGGGSAQENNLNTNPMGWGSVPYVSAANNGTLDQQNGKLFTGRTIFTSVPTTFTDTYILVSTTAGNVFGISSGSIPSDKTKTSYLYYRAGVTDITTPVIQTYRWDGNQYVADFSLWLRDVGHVNAPFQNANTVLKDSTGNDITTSGMTVVWRDGFAFGTGTSTSTGVNNVASYNLSIGIDVETTSDLASLYDSTDPNYIVDSGTEMSKYCAACHTDYLSTTRTNNTGLYSLAHRHATAQDRLTCVRCHYAHGSDAQIMKDANDNNYWNLTTGNTGAGSTSGVSPNGSTVNTMSTTAALQYLADPNPSSALKRYTGMSVCYACHGKGEAFLGDPNITGDTTTGQTLFNGDPGAEGTSGIVGGGRTPLTTRHNLATGVTASLTNN